ncbi:MAG: LysE family translocator [Alphaproteobacteria bacterium]|nr:LysE family translocator [Alphaproteobacteria bacterium]
MHWFLLWLAWASINLAATITPGPAFAMTVRTAMAHDRRAGIFQSFGLGLGIGTHVAVVACGLSVLLAQSAYVFEIIKYAGAAYLIYLGVMALKAKKKLPENIEDAAKPGRELSDLAAFYRGLVTNVLNPKSMVFFSAMFSQFMSTDTSTQMIFLYGITAVAIEIMWFSFVTLILTHRHVKNLFLSVSHWIERTCGGLMIALGLKLALSKVHA